MGNERGTIPGQYAPTGHPMETIMDAEISKAGIKVHKTPKTLGEYVEQINERDARINPK